jgi:energy-converting hydrogenase Eha subunit G
VGAANADRWVPPFRQSGRARGLAGLGWAEWAECGFSIFWNFPKAFLFIFSMDFKSNSNPIQIQTNSNMFIKQKNNLGST